MCGICGFAGSGGPSDTQRMADLLAHRGPDGEGFWSAPQKGVYLGHRRLAVIDLDDGAQPMTDPTQSAVVVYNGEIYNHRELREELQSLGRVFETNHSDTEVLVQGWLEWGEDLVPRLNGMWAFALYDTRKNRLFLSRDRFGQKPLFYAAGPGRFAFASELSALIAHSAIPVEVSSLAIQKYFAYGFIPAPHCLYENIFKLEPGTNLWVDCATFQTVKKPYWRFELEPFQHIPQNPVEKWSEELEGLLEQSVKRRLMSDVPLGVLLSGGIDSSSITAMASRHVDKGRLQTFCVGFAEKSFDESPHAQRVARLFSTDHHLSMLAAGEARDLFLTIARKLDEPMADSSLIPTYLLCRQTREKVTVALGGDGGDELFAGYDPFRALGPASLYHRLVPRPLHRAVRRLADTIPVSHENISLDFAVKRTLRGLSHDPALWGAVWMGPLEPGELSEIMDGPVDVDEVYSEAREAWDSARHLTPVDQLLQYYTRLYLADGILVKTDRASMMHSLEVRAPFLDKDLVDFVRRIPARYKLQRGQSKYLLKKCARRFLPGDVVDRKKKGFGLPVGQWIAQGSFGAPQCSLINRKFTDRAYGNHCQGKADERLFLYGAYVLGGFDAAHGA